MHLKTRLAASIFFLTLITEAHALSCAPRPSISTIVAASEHIFVAQIKSSVLSPDGQSVDATFAVEEVLKGSPERIPEIKARFSDYNYATDESQMPGVNTELTPGMHLLVFATGTNAPWYGPCTYTTKLHRHDAKVLEETRSAVSQK